MSEPIKMPSGSELKITLAPFSDAKALWQSILDEVKHLKIDAKTEIDANLIKDIFCYGFSSPKVEKALEVCMRRCTLNGLKIDKDTFEPEEFRQDYLMVCIEVVKENIMPFIQPLLAKFSQVITMTQSIQVQK